MNEWIAKDIATFADELASKSPVPGGGGTSALAGALGAALCSMVGNLTKGKKKYADVQDEVVALMQKAEALQQRLLELVARDAVVFEPLSQAYGLPKETPEEQQHRTQVMEACLKDASGVPLAIMQAAMEGIQLHARMADIGSAIAISDVGVGVSLCRSALQGGALNVAINTRLMKDRGVAEDMDKQVDVLLQAGIPLADEVFTKVWGKLR